MLRLFVGRRNIRVLGLCDFGKSCAERNRKIGDCAFQDCNIRNLKIDKTVRYIGEAAFTNSGNDYIFTSVSMLGADENDFYAIKDDCIVEKGSGPQYLGKTATDCLFTLKTHPQFNSTCPRA